MNVFVFLSENDKRLILALLLVLVLVFVLVGYIGYFVTRIMKWQGKKLDTLVADPVVTRVITKKLHFIHYSRKKNWRLFFKQVWPSVLILLTGALVLIIHNAIIKDFSYNLFDYEVTGCNTVLFLWDFSNCFSKQGIGFVLNWPVLINTPHLSGPAWASYVFMTCMIVGGGWYLIALQALIARTIRMYKLSTTVFEKNLDGFNQNTAVANQNLSPSNNPTEEEK